MIYNLTEYLKTQLTAIVFVTNGFAPDSNSESIVIIQNGGTVQHTHDRTDWAIQILSRAETVTKAKYNIELVFNLLKNKFGLILPLVIVDGVTYNAIKTYQISPIQQPGYIGADDKNLEMWSVNFIITTT